MPTAPRMLRLRLAPLSSVSFPQPRDLGPRVWGSETLVAFLPGHFTGKIMHMNKGTKGGLQYHRLKHEFGHLISGLLLLRYDAGDGKLSERILEAGNDVEIPPFAVHQEEALTDCVLVEFSTPVFNDRVRVETLYGLPGEGGLPTTQESEIYDAPR